MIRATNLTLGYKDDDDIIDQATFSIKDSEFIFIGGKSGSGKTTLLKSLYGQLTLRSGELIINGKNIATIDYEQMLELRQNIGIVFQDFNLLEELTVKENIMLPLKIQEYDQEAIEQQVQKLLKHIQLTHKANNYPSTLSGGEQQRIAVARALAHNPELIIVDEPTGNLDEYSVNVVWELLKNANLYLKTTIIAVSHNIPSNFEIAFRKFNIKEGVLYEIF